MSTYNHSAISNGDSNDASTVNTPLGTLDAAIGDLTSLTTTAKSNLMAALNEVRAQAITWGATVLNNQLKEWVDGECYELTAITYHGTYTDVISTATVKWPDASGGTFTATTINSTYWAIDAYTVSHSASGKTVTQTAVTRNSSGNITAKPAITVA